MSRDENIAALSTIVPIVQRRAWDQLDEVIAPNVVDHDPDEGQPPGSAGIKWYWRNYTAAFPDFRAELVALSADDDYATLVVQHFGTHTAEYEGFAPTGRPFSIRSIHVVKFADGLVVERWGAGDMLGLRQQLGLM